MKMNGVAMKVTIPGKIGPYIFKEEIGCGKTSVVYHAVSTPPEEEEVAIKVVPKSQFRNQAEITKLQNEVSSLFKCQNYHVVRFINLYHDSVNFYLVTELCDTDLQVEVSKSGKFPEDEAKKIFKEIIESIKFVHSVGVAHRDIKLDNFLIKNSGKTKKIILSDFGFSLLVCEDKNCTIRCGTLAYLAPEIIKNEPYNPYLVDIWSAGVVLYSIVAGRFPWPTSNNDIMIEWITTRKLKFPDFFSEDLKNLIDLMLNLNPEERPTLNIILEHPWLKNVVIEKIEEPETKYKPPSFKALNEIFRSAAGQRVIVERNQNILKRQKVTKSLNADIKNTNKDLDKKKALPMSKDLREVLQKSHRLKIHSRSTKPKTEKNTIT
ncbi:CAMK family protein kinase [Tritrichomonas foetus]|uniref:CAMK family protein kinase n=1 Tax=Tritrichomonas foetus TaxID=1144522 RepID=A0A1J4KDJ2_9EUKA|nr:CAMK family protein kinase [Tritrichomonas foetus]|eukprot:OHT08984.1 CAMK family protein kinase [Tritrichomonas foetus]